VTRVTTQPFTVIQGDGAVRVAAVVDADARSIRLSADAVRSCLGWERKDEGLCRDDVCIPARRLEGVEDEEGHFELSRLAALLGRPLAFDIDASAAFVGVAAPERSALLARFEAPDFTLPDLDGRLHSLSDHRGKKVFLATWASW
jgi:hypothetical protein